MAEAGVIGGDERLELLDGVICRVSPEDSRQAAAVEIARQTLTERLGSRFGVCTQHPLRLDAVTEPEPDVAVVDSADPRT